MKSPGKTAAIILASGFSKRFGERNKLLVPFKGKPLARYALELAAGLDFDGGIFFITASKNTAILAEELPSIKVIKNSYPEKGLRESVRLGLEAAMELNAGEAAEYYLFFHCDQPFLDAETVQRIIGEARPSCIVEPRYMGKPGNPSLFSAFYYEELLSLKEGETPRVIKLRHPEALRVVEVSDSLVLEDIDDEETLKRLEKLTGEN